MDAASQATRKKWLKEFNNNDDDPFKFLTSTTAFCKVCEASFIVKKRTQLQQHLTAQKHATNSRLKMKRSATQAQLKDILMMNPKESKSTMLARELCEAMLAANIPWKKLQNKKLRDFLETHIGLSIPNETTLRKLHLDFCYNKVIQQIREKMTGSSVYVSVDETTDVQGRYVTNVIVGQLDKHNPHPPYLVRVAFLHKVDSSAIARLVNDTLRFLWPNFDERLFKLFLTDSAAYMLKAGRDLKIFYPNLLSVTCLAHALHRLCEEIRNMFVEVDELIVSVKKIFIKAPSRVLIWKQMYPTLPLPPKPVITRWGTWLTAALFYAEHLKDVKDIVRSFDSESALCIKKAQQSFESEELQCSLAFISAQFSFFPSSITKLENRQLLLVDAISILDEVKVNIDKVPGEVGQRIQRKFEAVMARNPGITKLRSISSILKNSSGEMPEGFSPEDIADMKFSPTTSVDVERSFSVYNNILSDRRQSFSEENLSKVVISHCFYTVDNF